MQKASRAFALGIVFTLVFSTAAMACHSDYFIDVFTKMQKQNLNKDQITALMSLKTNFSKQKSLDHTKGLSCSSHDKHVPTFIAAAAGILNDEQFEKATGKPKTEVQKLRFEVNELRKEIKEIKELLRQIKK